MLRCTKFPTEDVRILRLKQKGLCEACTGDHAKSECPAQRNNLSFACTYCGSKKHISAVCLVNRTNPSNQAQVSQNHMGIVINQASLSASTLIPSMSMIIYDKDQKGLLVRCMLDPGSQSSYISDSLRQRLKLSNDLPTRQCNIKTFMGTTEKKYGVAQCICHLTPINKVEATFLVDKDFDVDYYVPGISEIITELKKYHKLADSFYTHDLQEDDKLRNFDCLIGADLMTYITPLSSVHIGASTALQVSDGLILMGDVHQYVPQLNQSLVDDNLTAYKEPKEDRLINFMLNPSENYFNPIEYAKSDSDIDLKVENLFKIESLGIKEEELAQTVKDKVKQFEDSIEFKNVHYYIDLPFKDEISQVTSNWKIAKSAMHRVYNDLLSKNLVQAYTTVFDQQLASGIIEELHITESEYDDYHFIAHHPVIKTEAQVTTKVRPVFSCSYKSHATVCSLNRACFEGIDLLTNLVQLLLQFQQNQYVLLGDIEKAFLQILLKAERDQNKFCFFWQDEHAIKVYRYRSIIFGLNVSPFVLNRVIQNHLKHYPLSTSIKALKECFYVDNFVFSTSNEEELLQVYEESRKIMAEGGFNLQSFVSNHTFLQQIFHKENTATQHSALEEKVLGYLYDPVSDEISLSPVSLKTNADRKPTKREILGKISKVFDPLSLILPVTVKGKTLMKQIWAEGTGWDESVSDSAAKM